MKTKELVFFLIDTNQTKNMLVVTTPNIYQKEGSDVEALYGRLVRYGKYRWAKGEIFKSSDPNLMKYSQNRTFKTKVSYKEVEQSVADQLKANAEKIDSFTHGVYFE
jgi:hypothetical protein